MNTFNCAVLTAAMTIQTAYCQLPGGYHRLQNNLTMSADIFDGSVRFKPAPVYATKPSSKQLNKTSASFDKLLRPEKSNQQDSAIKHAGQKGIQPAIVKPPELSENRIGEDLKDTVKHGTLRLSCLFEKALDKLSVNKVMLSPVAYPKHIAEKIARAAYSGKETALP